MTIDISKPLELDDGTPVILIDARGGWMRIRLEGGPTTGGSMNDGGRDFDYHGDALSADNASNAYNYPIQWRVGGRRLRNKDMTMKNGTLPLRSDMMFPLKFKNTLGTLELVVQGVINDTAGAVIYYGVSGNGSSERASVWDSDGRCVYSTSTKGSSDYRRLSEIKSNAQIVFEKLDADGKAIVLALNSMSSGVALIRSYLKDKVNINLEDNATITEVVDLCYGK
jgi:hypothetical protein